MKTIYTPAAWLLLIFGLSPLMGQKSVYSFPFENTYRLPAMEIWIDQEELSATYQTINNLYTTEVTGLGEETMEQTSRSFITDNRAVDAVRFLEYYMKDQLIAPGEPVSGLVEMSVIYFHEDSRYNAGSVLGVLTFGLGTLLGIPYATTVTDVEIEASFYDADDQLVAVHRGVGKGRKTQSMFSHSNRKAHQKALINALEELNTHIMGDSIFIAEQAVIHVQP